MSHQMPIFNGDLLGKANRIVMNGLVSSADFVDRNRSAMDWARVQMQPDNFEIQHFLAILINYQLLQPNRWIYKFRRASLDWLSGNVWYQEVLNAEDDTVNNFLAVNLYEFVNTGSFTQDGDLATPPTTVGPVGAWYDFGAQSWSMLDPSSALVIMHKAYAVNGDISYFFSHPNPMRCLDTQEPV